MGITKSLFLPTLNFVFSCKFFFAQTVCLLKIQERLETLLQISLLLLLPFWLPFETQKKIDKKVNENEMEPCNEFLNATFNV